MIKLNKTEKSSIVLTTFVRIKDLKKLIDLNSLVTKLTKKMNSIFNLMIEINTRDTFSKRI